MNVTPDISYTQTDKKISWPKIASDVHVVAFLLFLFLFFFFKLNSSLWSVYRRVLHRYVRIYRLTSMVMVEIDTDVFV